MSRVSVDQIHNRYRDIALKARLELDQLKENLETEDISISVLLRKGTPGDVILDVCNEISADLIVLGANGKDSLSDYFLGTTASHVVDQSKVPILTISLS